MHRDLEQSRSLWTMKQLSKYLLAVFDVLLLLLCDSLSLPNLAPNQVESKSWLVAKLCNQVALVSSTSQFVALQKCSKIEPV